MYDNVYEISIITLRYIWIHNSIVYALVGSASKSLLYMA